MPPENYDRRRDEQRRRNLNLGVGLLVGLAVVGLFCATSSASSSTFPTVQPAETEVERLKRLRDAAAARGRFKRAARYRDQLHQLGVYDAPDLGPWATQKLKTLIGRAGT